jgi:hypothetical protein
MRFPKRVTFTISQFSEIENIFAIRRGGFMLITAAQCRAGRALLGMTQSELAIRAKVTPPTIRDFENCWRKPIDNNLHAIHSALVECGVVFLDAEDGEYHHGVALLHTVADPKSVKKETVKSQNGGDRDADTHAMIEFWRDNPAEWAGLHDDARQVLLERMFGKEVEVGLFGRAAE